MALAYCLKSARFAMICLFLLMASGCGSGLNPSSLAELPTGTKTFNVATYGAKGDGKTDDAMAIQRAMTAASVAGGGTVSFPCGEFSIQSSAGGAPGGRSLLYLKAAAAVQLQGLGSCSHLFTTLPQKSVLEFEDSDHITVTQLRITALNAIYIETFGMDGGSAVRFSGVAYGSISSVEVDGATAGALYFTKGTSHSTMLNNNIHDTYGGGIWEDDCGAASTTSCAPSSPPTYNLYQTNTLTNTALAMSVAMTLDDGSASSFGIVKGNTLSWTRAPLQGHEMVHCIQISNASDVTLLNNSCIATPYDAIIITAGVNSHSDRDTIQGNVIQSTGSPGFGGSGIVLYGDPGSLSISGFVISNNSITTAANDGIRTVTVGPAGSIHDGQIINNSINMVDQLNPGTSYGINVRNSAAITITGNVVTGNGKCIAVGVTVAQSTTTKPAVTDNQAIDILGPSLFIM